MCIRDRGKALTAMPGLTRVGVLGEWPWQVAEEDAVTLEVRTLELSSQYLRFIERYGREPMYLDSHGTVPMFAQIFAIA
ncbi:chitooligosaccharide deacetylase, partial [Escherichia coli]|nr:chitooligosaccharide deacetylase [Escherichia coli]